ncbi:hypothetical protein EDC96DRAFT_591660 [Choanephora cucurbitarum]|nr:hypothetical protein EDC96DRAFT_591660 [Choanephora cucurbitarum]
MMETTSFNNPLNASISNDYIKTKDNTHRPRVIQWDPHMGTDQTTLTVVLEKAASNPMHSPLEEIKPMRLVFGQLVVETSQQHQNGSNDTMTRPVIWITLVARVPKLKDTKMKTGNQVPLSICVYDGAHSDTAIDHWSFGLFTYMKEEPSRKRSSTDQFINKFPTKRPSLDDDPLFNQLLVPLNDPNTKTELPTQGRQPTLMPSTGPSLLHAYPIPPYLESSSNYNNYHPPPSRSAMTHQIQTTPSSLQYASCDPNNMPYASPTSSSSTSGQFSSQPIYTIHPPQNNTSPTFANYPHPLPPPSPPPHPAIFHSQMMLPVPPTSTHLHPMPSLTSHPFAGVLSKANLKIMGDLMDMTYNWTAEEWTSGRRLVQFWRRQHGGLASQDKEEEGGKKKKEENEVECGFEPVSQESYQQQRIRENLASKDIQAKKPSPLVISCIYWQEQNDYFITSVDCIYLLEGLIGVQFTVEEKNRIRRNLEGFRPLTVSKCKPECADFFKLIMGFPHPKPRNIEKDVKVFPWKTLPHALKKIIRKYTPSYSSTAVVNLNH